MSKPRIIKFKKIKLATASLMVLEKLIPFNIKRIFFVYLNKSKEIRGRHAHKKCHEIIFSLDGEVEVNIFSKNKNKKFILSKPNHGLYLPPKNWIEYRNLKNKSILFVLCSHIYTKKDYIQNFQNFINYRKKNEKD